MGFEIAFQSKLFTIIIPHLLMSFFFFTSSSILGEKALSNNYFILKQVSKNCDFSIYCHTTVIPLNKVVIPFFSYFSFIIH